MKKQLISAAALAVVVAGIGPSSVSAERPVERVRFVDEFGGVAPLFSEHCGVADVTVDGIARVQISEFADGSVRVHENTNITFTNAATGDQVFLASAVKIDDAQVAETIEDNLRTLVFETDYTGTPERWRAPRFGVIVRDAGRATIRTTVVIDLTIDPELADPVVSVTQEVLSQDGPHPLLDQGFVFDAHQGAELCEAIGGQLGS